MCVCAETANARGALLQADVGQHNTGIINKRAGLHWSSLFSLNDTSYTLNVPHWLHLASRLPVEWSILLVGNVSTGKWMTRVLNLFNLNSLRSLKLPKTMFFHKQINVLKKSKNIFFYASPP